MIKKIAQYTCVFVCFGMSFPCLGDSGSGPADAPAVDRTGAPKASIAPGDMGTSTERSIGVLLKARDTNEEIYRNLHSFVCSEEIERFRGPFETAAAKRIDTVTATVSFENGTEHYSDIRQNTKLRPDMSSLGGAWSEGEFGTLLQQTQTLLSTQTPVFEAYENLDGTPAAVFEVEVSATGSPWDLVVRSQHYRVPFRSRVWISESGGEILKIERTSTYMPAGIGISEIRWNVQLKQVDLNGKTWLLPSVGEYAVFYDDASHREWNVMRFTNYHRYGSEVAIRFE